VRNLDELVFHPNVTFLIGDNGSGKSTLIEALAIAGGFDAEGGRRNFNFDAGARGSRLHEFVRPVRSLRAAKDGFFLRAERVFGVGAQALETGAARAHGDAFFALMEHGFGEAGLYVLDEPEAALSPIRQLSFLVRMHELVGQKSQFIIATHSPIILAYPNAWIYQTTENGLARVAYEDTEHFRVTREFLSRREAILDALLTGD
jgi:predicted ATPase